MADLEDFATAVGALTKDARLNAVKGGSLGTAHLDTITTPGGYFQWASADATTGRGYPFNIYGNLLVYSQHDTDANIVQQYMPSPAFASGYAIRSQRSGTWGPWDYYQSASATQSQVNTLVSSWIAGVADQAATTGMKTVPLALGLGFGSDYQAPAACSFRVPLLFTPDVARFRIHIRNSNPRTGSLRAGAGEFTGVWHGKHAANGAFTASPTQIVPAFTTPADGSEWVSDWINQPLGGGTEYLLSFAYTSTATVKPVFTAGGSWRNDTSAAHGPTIAPTMTRENLIPFDIWMEAETASTTPVIAGFGDSLTAGIGADFTVQDSWVSQYARAHGALPVHYAIGGTTMGSWHDGFYAFNRWQGFARPDAVIWAMGSNDIFTGSDLATLQTRHANLAPLLAAKVSSRIHAATIMPRTNQTGATEDVRRAYNAWLATRPNGVREVFDFADSISTDDETIIPAYDSDGTHLTAEGYAQNAAAITSAITAPSLSLAVDGLSERVAALEGTSGIRNVSTLLGLSSGTALLDVRDGTVRIDFLAAQWAGTGNIDLTNDGLTSVAPEAPRNSVNDDVMAGTTPRRIQVNMYGFARIYAYATGDVINGYISWPMTRPTPTIWPGNPA